MNLIESFSPWLRLHMTSGVGNITARRLLSAFGQPKNIWQQAYSSLSYVVGEAQTQALLREPDGFEQAYIRTAQWLDEDSDTRTILMLDDPRYPQSLLQLSDAPTILFIEGKTAHTIQFDFLRTIAIVGSRNPSTQGHINAKSFSKSLAQTGFCIVSGMALGVDASAHEGALEGASNAVVATIAILGTGLDRIYPRQHQLLSQRIAEKGLLVSEFLLGTAPIASNFPKRNRIIAALAQGTLVVEAAVQSGSLITARLTADLGKDVYAIPGSIHSPQAKGCHALIKQGAKLVENVTDILDEMPEVSRLQPEENNKVEDGVDESTSTIEQKDDENNSILLRVLGFEACSLDSLLARIDLDTAELQVALLELELLGQVIRVPGGLYQRVVRK
jgi:DNA processing protein